MSRKQPDHHKAEKKNLKKKKKKREGKVEEFGLVFWAAVPPQGP
jgi:hypothetical protein